MADPNRKLGRPRRKLENGRLRKAYALADFLPESDEPTDLAKSQSIVDFYADDTPPFESRWH